MKLTPKQEKFANLYVELGNASEAYRRSYSCEKMKDETVNERSSRLLKEYKVSTRVKQLQYELQERSKITKDKVLAEFAKVAFSSIAHLHNTWIERIEFDELTADQKASIKSISTKIIKKNIGASDDPEIVDVEYVKVELYDKLKALDSINDMLGFKAPVKGDITSNGETIGQVTVFELPSNGRDKNK